MSIENSDSEKPISADASNEPNSGDVNTERTNGVDVNTERTNGVDVSTEPDTVVDSSETSQATASSENIADAPSTKVVYRVDQPETPLDEETLLKLLDDNNSPPEPTETYAHPVTGREVYVPKNSKALGPSALLLTAALMMFVGGALATASMVARAFDIHGQALLIFVIASSAFILSLAGGLLVRTLGDGDKWWVGAGVGACFGAMGAVIVYLQTRHYAWWQ